LLVGGLVLDVVLVVMNPPDAQLMRRVDLCKMVVTVVSHSDDLSVVWCCAVRVQLSSELGRQVFDVLPYF
jgi:hypothetical protein